MLFSPPQRGEIAMKISANQEAAQWAQLNFSKIFATDIRRIKRIIKIAEMMARLPGKSIPQFFETQYDIKAAYEIFKHPESTPSRLQRGHRNLIHKKLKNENGVYLLLEDATDIVFIGRREIQGLGPVPGKADSVLKGFLLHTVLAVRYPENHTSEDKYGRRSPAEIIGIADQQYHVRAPSKNQYKSRQFETRGRESDLWLNSQKNIGKRPDKKDIKWISVCDRAADIYEYMVDSSNNNRNYIVRAKHDRILTPGSSSKSLFEYSRGLEEVGTFKLDLRSRPGQSAKIVNLSLSYGSVSLRAPQRPGFRAGSLRPIENTVIHVKEKGSDLEDTLEWILLTDLNVDSYEKAYQIVEWYSSRWIIEDYHKALKSGMKVEELQLDTQHSIFAAISLMAVAALRLVNLREIIRLRSAAPSVESSLDELELILLEKINKKKLKTVEDVGKALGRLGGHMGRKADGMPGMMTLWRGYSRLRDMSEGVRLIELK